VEKHSKRAQKGSFWFLKFEFQILRFSIFNVHFCVTSVSLPLQKNFSLQLSSEKFCTFGIKGKVLIASALQFENHLYPLHSEMDSDGFF